MTDVVRHNFDTHRAVTACECGATVSLPDSGVSRHDCGCGRVWTCDGQNLAMYEPKDRQEPTTLSISLYDDLKDETDAWLRGED